MLKLIQGYDTWSELDILTGMIFGEARGEETAGRVGVALTALTRVKTPKWWGRNWREVILCPKQFSCWDDINKDKISTAKITRNIAWKACKVVAEDVYLGKIVDYLGGPTHYHTTLIHPDWASGMKKLTTIGNHIFYRDEREFKNTKDE